MPKYTEEQKSKKPDGSFKKIKIILLSILISIFLLILSSVVFHKKLGKFFESVMMQVMYGIID
ncbi:hypothetical protein QUF75_10805 [Desulfococcaceae bacterium HSG7]|nr:hypothetical protein [Desulfococcaceae bacterium HSG7]